MNMIKGLIQGLLALLGIFLGVAFISLVMYGITLIPKDYGGDLVRMGVIALIVGGSIYGVSRDVN